MNVEALTDKSDEAAAVLAMLSNAYRLRILCELHSGERSVSQLEDIVGLSQSALSQHLAKLRGCGILKTRREAQTVYYSILDDRVGRLLTVLVQLFCVEGAPPERTWAIRTGR